MTLMADRRSVMPALPASLFTGGAILLTWLFLAAFAPLVSGHDPNAIDVTATLQRPGALHWFGTDAIGRDVLSRTLHAARVDLFMCLAGVVPALVIGVTIGLVSGYLGGGLDQLLMRIYDITVAFPFFVLVLAIVGVLGPGLMNYFIALAVVGWVTYARLVRAEVLVVRSSEYVAAARGLGFSPLYIMRRHVLPNVLSPAIVYAMTDAILVILAGASLGFLGMGAQPPTAEWGVMVAEGQPFIVQAWWISFFPGLAAVSLGFGLALMGDGLARLLRVTR
jgi:peptide/nickel transport system permease protein